MSAPATAVKTDTYPILYNATMFVFWLFGGGIEVKGEENLPKEGAVLLVSNHISYLDPCLIGDGSPRRVSFMAKAELFENKLLNWLLRGVDCFPVRRGEADTSAIKAVLSQLKEGRCVVIFPEGKRSPDGDLQEAEEGAAMLATRTGCPVVPVYVSGTNKLLDRKGRLHRAKVSMSIGEPFTLPKSMPRDEAAKELMRQIAATRDAFEGKTGRWMRLSPLNKPKEGSRRAA
ncbi:MAG: lysophospholipid acyltransferase family protein [Armatimonas sp.]